MAQTSNRELPIMRGVLVRTGLTVLAVAMMILHFGAMLGHAREFDLAGAASQSVAIFVESGSSARDAQEGDLIQPSGDLHCQFNANLSPQAAFHRFVSFKCIGCPPETCPAGLSVNVFARPPISKTAA